MPDSPYARFLPLILKWIRNTLDAYALQKRSVESFAFQKLPEYFRPSLLHTTNVVLTDVIPVPPLSAWGLSEFAWIQTPLRAVTYQDTYFLETSTASSEAIHFHELIHAIQWRVLGPEDFLLLYAVGLVEHGYKDSPLEAIAYAHQAKFENGESPYSVEGEVGAATLALLPAIAQPSANCCDIVDSDSGEIISIEDICARVGPGWRPLLKDLLLRMSVVGWDGRIAQVKEKMGCLLVYIDQNSLRLEKMIELAGERSKFTCEICGSAPPRNSDGSATMWRCEGCAPDERRHVRHRRCD
jgi:hypothetical protein